MRTAQTGRTHDLHPTASKSQKLLDPWAPSTHDPERTIQARNVRPLLRGRLRASF